MRNRGSHSSAGFPPGGGRTSSRFRRMAGGVLWLLAGLSVVWAVVRWALVVPPVAETPLFSALERPLLIAHQGGEGIRPGNTLEAFLHAWELGAPMSEMDIHSTADGFLVLIHDDTVDVTTEGTGPVLGMELAALQTLDAAYHWSPDGGATHPFRGQGIRIPTLDAVLDSLPDSYFNLELKQVDPSVAAQVCAAVRQRGIQERVLAASFSTRALREFRRECPEVATSAGAWEARAFLLLHHLRLTRAWTPPFEAIQLPPRSKGFRILTPRLLRSAQERNLEVHAWTINESEEMRALLDLGVDGLVTDFPDRMLEVLEGRDHE
jgi:glycerophosphoryl diester phosphodiesterase